jgi:Mn-containing catalase
LQANPRYSHTYFNMSNGQDGRGPWNQGQGPWTEGEWVYVSDPVTQVRATEVSSISGPKELHSRKAM